MARVRSLLLIRMVGLLDLLRRSGALAHRRMFGLTSLEWRIMAQVGSNAPLSLGQLAELLILDRGQLSRAVKGLVTRGLLDSRRRPGSPAIMITLTPSGDAIHAEMVEVAIERNAFLTAELDDEDIERISALLLSTRDKAQLMLDRERELMNGSAEPDPD